MADSYDAFLRRQILEAYGFNEATMTPEDRALWDAYGRVMDAVDAWDKASAANVMALAKAAPGWATERMRQAGELPEGLHFEWSER